MKLALTIRERLVLQSKLLPTQGSMQEMHSANLLSKKLALTDSEKQEYEYKVSSDGFISFKPSEKECVIDISSDEKDLLKLIYKIADEQKTVTKETFSIFVKIKEL